MELYNVVELQNELVILSYKFTIAPLHANIGLYTVLLLFIIALSNLNQQGQTVQRQPHDDLLCTTSDNDISTDIYQLHGTLRLRQKDPVTGLMERNNQGDFGDQSMLVLCSS